MVSPLRCCSGGSRVYEMGHCMCWCIIGVPSQLGRIVPVQLGTYTLGISQNINDVSSQTPRKPVLCSSLGVCRQSMREATKDRNDVRNENPQILAVHQSPLRTHPI